MSAFSAFSNSTSNIDGIFQHEKVLRFYESIEAHFNSLLDTLQEKKVFNEGLANMQNWDAKTIEKELQVMKSDDEDIELFATHSMCQYLKDTYKPPGLKIRVRTPKAFELIKKFANCIALNKTINTGAYFTLSVIEKEKIMKKCFRRALRKVCTKNCIIEETPSYASSRSGGVIRSIMSKAKSEKSMTSSLSSLSRKTSIVPDESSSQLSKSSRLSKSSLPKSQVSKPPRSTTQKSRAPSTIKEAESEKEEQRSTKQRSITPDDSVSQAPSNVSSRANTVHGKLTAGMLEMHRKRSLAPEKLISLKGSVAKSQKGFFDLSHTGPSEVM